MSRVLPLIGFGFTLVVGGMFWVLWDDSRSYFDSLIIEDSYYILMRTVWAWIPAIILFVGMMCLISAGITKAREKRVEY